MGSAATWTWVWLTISFAIVVIVSYIGMKRAKTLKDYLIAGGTSGPLVIALAWMAAWDSGGAMIGTPGVAYGLGYSAVAIWGYAVVAVPLTVMLVSTRLREFSQRTGAYTFTEIVGQRYNSDTMRVIVAVMMIIFMFISTIAQLKGGGVSIQAVTGFSWEWSVVIIGLICILASASGGMRSVAWSAALLCVIMLLAVIIYVVGALKAVGWFTGLEQKLFADQLGLQMGLKTGLHGNMLVSWLASPKYFDTTRVFGELSIFGLIGWFFALGLGTIGLPHTGTMYLSLKPLSKREYRFFIYLITGLAALMSSVMFYGLAARAYLGPKYLEMGNLDLAIPTMATQIFSGPVAGFIVTAFILAVVTTVGSILMVTVTSAVRTIYKLWVKNPSEKGEIWWSRIGIVIFGVAAAIVTISNPPAYLARLHYLIYSSLGFGFLFAVVLSLYWQRANLQGALISLIVATVVTLMGFLVFQWPTGTTMFVSFIATAISWVVGTLSFPATTQPPRINTNV